MKMIQIRPLLAATVLLAACEAGAGDNPSLAPDSAPSAAAAADSTPAPADSAAPSIAPAWVMRFDGAGPLRVGMTLDEARAALGGDLRMSAPGEGIEGSRDRCDYPQSGALQPGVRVMVEGQRLVRIEVDSGTVSTAEGARVGDTEARITQLYPGRVTVQPHKYTDGHYLVVRPTAAADTTHLLVFETDGRVVQAIRAGQKPQVEYVEGCS
jgi:hypothetical protein